MTWMAPAHVLKQKTHCVHGHEYERFGIYRKDDGYRRCKECKRVDDTAYRQSKVA